MITVLAHGTFDLLHYGHILMFEAARAMGDRLVVTLTADAFVAKGPGRPVFNEQQRLHWVKSIRYVDEAFVIHEKTGVAAIAMVKPQIYAKGRDTLQWTNVIAEEQAAIESIGGRLEYIDTGTVFHSGDLMSGRYMRDWQPINTHPLKEGFEDCLVWDGKKIRIAHQSIYGDWTAGSEYDDFYLKDADECGLTHWMPLPKGPNK